MLRAKKPSNGRDRACWNIRDKEGPYRKDQSYDRIGVFHHSGHELRKMREMTEHPPLRPAPAGDLQNPATGACSA